MANPHPSSMGERLEHRIYLVGTAVGLRLERTILLQICASGHAQFARDELFFLFFISRQETENN